MGAMAQPKARYTSIACNKKFEVHVLDPKSARRDNVKLTLHSDDGQTVFHHLRAYEVVRLVAALDEAIAFGPIIPER
jgi:hypothetical protein